MKLHQINDTLDKQFPLIRGLIQNDVPILFSPCTGWEGVDGTMVLGKVDCIVVYCRERDEYQLVANQYYT